MSVAISRVIGLLAAIAALHAADVSPAIHVDQVGYAPKAPKFAVVTSTLATGSFTVRRVGDGETVFQGALSSPKHDDLSGDTVRRADFSALQAGGDYYLEVAGLGNSYPFGIHTDVFRRAFYLAMRGYYGHDSLQNARARRRRSGRNVRRLSVALRVSDAACSGIQNPP